MDMRQLVDAEGLATVLRSVAELLRDASQAYPFWSLAEGDVGEVISQAQAIRQLSHTLTAVVASEAESRGLASTEGLSPVDWLWSNAEALPSSQAPALALVAAALNEPRWKVLGKKVASGAASVELAAAILRFHGDVARIADPEHLDGIVTAMVDACDVLTLKELNRLVAHGRASLKPPAELESDEAALRAGRALHKVGSSAGLTEYRLRLDPEGAAILDAAIDPLARPRPDLDWDGSEKTDPRLPATRRADALLEIVGRAVAAPEGVTRTPRTQLVVTMSLEALLGQIRGAGVCDNDAVLSPGAVRRLACEATVIPTVLGAPSEVLDVGRSERCFTRAQRRALTVRDRGCSFPGCTMPPQWCEAHHVTHWADGGPTDLLNGALLCGRHHTVVHQRGMGATVTALGVRWHR
jgi:hypothetical protein